MTPQPPPARLERQSARLRACAIVRCVYYAAVPWWVYEAEKHHRGTYLQHAWQNLAYARDWLLGTQSPDEEAFERDNKIIWPRLARGWR